MPKPKAFYSYLENESKLNKLSDEEAGKLYKALYAYSSSGVKPDFSDDPRLDYAFEDFVIDIDRDREKYEQTCKRRAEAGRKGGQANASAKQANQANASFASSQEAKTSKSSETEAEIEAEVTTVTKEKKEKEKFGEFQNVLLTVDEVLKLESAFPKDWKDRIERLSRYLAQTGKKYESHYATILVWSRKDKEKPPDKRGSVFSVETASFDLDKCGGSPKGCG